MGFFIYISLFYAAIALANIPYEIAKKRNHPQQDAILIAGWFSLLTLLSMWPFIWIWATLYREDRGWGFQPSKNLNSDAQKQLDQLQSRFDKLEERLSETQNIKGAN